MGLFGGNNEKKAAEDDYVRAQLERLAAMDLATLGAEVLHAAFGPDSPNGGKPIALVFVQQAISRSDSVFGVDLQQRAELDQIVEEGLQALEHAGLVLSTFSGGDHAGMSWRPTRTGHAAIADGSAAERIRARLT